MRSVIAAMLAIIGAAMRVAGIIGVPTTRPEAAKGAMASMVLSAGRNRGEVEGKQSEKRCEKRRCGGCAPPCGAAASMASVSRVH